MTNGRLPRSALLLLLTLSSTAHVGAQPRSRSIYASALDQNGAPVPDLGPGDFIVREDKVTREILRTAPADDPMQILLLVDNSTAAEPYIRDYREALTAFINEVAADPTGARHQVGIVTLADRTKIYTEATSDLPLAVKGAQRIFSVPDSGAYLLDGIIETSQGILKRDSPRPVIVVITTEGPEMSDRNYQTVLEPLRASGAAMHVVTIGRPDSREYDRAVVADIGTKESGGRNDIVFTGTALVPRLKQIAAELTHQYRVTYARPDSLIPPRQVTVSSAKPGMTVRGTPVKAPRERP